MRLPPALLVVTATLVVASCATTGDKASLYPPRPEVVPHRHPPPGDSPLTLGHFRAMEFVRPIALAMARAPATIQIDELHHFHGLAPWTDLTP